MSSVFIAKKSHKKDAYCLWTQREGFDMFFNATYETDCGWGHDLGVGEEDICGYRYCTYCGKRIREKKWDNPHPTSIERGATIISERE